MVSCGTHVVTSSEFEFWPILGWGISSRPTDSLPEVFQTREKEGLGPSRRLPEGVKTPTLRLLASFFSLVFSAADPGPRWRAGARP